MPDQFCPHCGTLWTAPADAERLSFTVCVDCLEIVISDDGVLRKPYEAEIAIILASGAGRDITEVVDRVRRNESEGRFAWERR